MNTTRIPAEQLGSALEPLVREHFPSTQRARIDGFTRTERGFATETYLFEVSDDYGSVPLVMRRPPDMSLFPDYDLLRQVLVMKRLAGTGIPVPTVAWLERDDNPLGSPYFVMNRLEGRAPSDYPSYHAAGTYFEATPEQRARMWWGCVDTIAEVSRIDWRASGLEFLAFPQHGNGVIEQGVNYLDAALHWACEGNVPDTYRRAIAFLREHHYEPDEAVLCWGDARMSNILYDQDFQVRGVLDWEIAHLGAPESDLAWLLFLDWACSEYEGHAPLPGTPSRAETIAYYEKRTGTQVRNLEYQEIFSAALLSIPLLRMSHRVQLPPEMNITGFCTARIEQLLN
ncbi:phosphotransferase family protein [Nocardia sp. NPDC005825]|uniref:phosphotransferase family protein n=1 Tax=unclassified Nocardia TaxID=2637762 RepID=UPI0034032F81